MTRVHVVVEGLTEETFVNDVLAPALGWRGVYLTPCCLGRPGHRGGNVTYGRVESHVVKLLRQDKGAYCTTLFDLYGLGDGFSGNTPVPKDACRATQIERGLVAAIIAAHGDDLRADIRFIPYIQKYEFEGLLFSDPEKLAHAISQPQLQSEFQSIRGKGTPEDINDSPQTAPSKRILRIYPPYEKPFDGVLAAKAIGLAVIRRECPRFNAWIERLEAL